MMEPKNWMTVAEKELGIYEIRGERHHPRIIFYHSFTTLRAKEDEIPWCSSFVCAIMEMSGYDSTRSAAARSWLKYGQKVEPQYGAIMVFSRGGNPKLGHVAFYVYQDKDYYYCLGGNQNDSVCVRPYAKNTLIQARLPRMVDKNGIFSD